jgi:hypothetical protein
MKTQASFKSGSDSGYPGVDGPFLFCDYWASVLNLRDIVNLKSLSEAGLSLELFRKILNRPSAALPRFGYFILASITTPFVALFRGILRIAGIRKKQRDMPYDRDAMRNLLLKHALKVEARGGGLVDVFYDGRQVASQVVDPLRVRASSTMFFARYKIFLASLVAIGYGALIGPVSSLFGAEHVLLPYLGVLSYPIVLVILYFMFNDLLTATVAPLPLIAIRMIIRIGQGFQGFVIAAVGVAFVLYLVEWFFVPRSLPPALYLYVNDQDSQHYPYKPGHEPYWLSGKYYWVWRFVTLAPAELIKFWEKDWERVEIWMRADGQTRGRIEWIVTDWHYRELWFRYERFTGKISREIQEKILRTHIDSINPLTWVIEMDMDLVFHSPVVRGIYLAPGKKLSLWRRLHSILSVIFTMRAQEDPEKHKRSLELLEIQGSEFLEDLPEHFRAAATRRLLSLPWSYWRFPRGVRSRRALFVYGGAGDLDGGPELASDRRFQIKEPG